MRPAFRILAALLLAGCVTPPVLAQSSDRGSGNVYGPYSVYGPGLTSRPPSSFSVPTFTSVRVQSSVVVPDGGEALLGGYSSLSEGRREAGVPLLGKTPYLNRGFSNVGSGRSISRTTVSVRARVIILAEEEERQTGVRP